MNAVGIDVSKEKSMIAVMRPLGEVVAVPFEVGHTAAELDKLARFILKIDGETRVIMEYTGSYYEPIAYALHEVGLYVSTVHAQLIHDFGNNTIRKVKTDKADSMKIAAYGLAKRKTLLFLHDSRFCKILAHLLRPCQRTLEQLGGKHLS
jgi:transposase